MVDNTSLGKLVLDTAIENLRSQKRLVERAVAQLTDEQLHECLNSNMNSIAVIIKHVAGNMQSRWTDLLTCDGEKPWRNRDSEFIDDIGPRDQLQSLWEAGWARLFATLSSLTSDDLAETIRIRGKPVSVIYAIHRQLWHYGFHIGQIILVARSLLKDNWTCLSIPAGGSEEYNQHLWKSQGRTSGWT